MKIISKMLTLLLFLILILCQINVLAVGISDFEIGFEADTKSKKQTTTLTQNADGLTVHASFTSNADLRNLFLSSHKISIKPLTVEFTIDKCTFPNDLANGYLNFNLFKDLSKSKTIGVNIMFLLAPVGLSDSFQWMTDNNKYTGDGATKTWVLIQDITGNKINEADAWTISEENPNGVPEMGFCIDKPYVGSHSFSYDAATGNLTVDGVKIKIRAQEVSRINMKDTADLIIQSGGSSYKKEMQYTLKKINGKIVDNKSGPVGPTSSVSSSNNSSKSGNTSSQGNSSVRSSTSSTGSNSTGTNSTDKNSSATTNSVTDSNNTDTSSASGDQPPVGQNIGTKNLDTRIDFENKVVTLYKDFTVGSLMENFNVATGYTSAVCDSTGKVISDKSLKVDTTMKYALYFGDISGEPDTVFAIAIDSSASLADNGNPGAISIVVFIIIAVVVVVLAAGVIIFFVLKRNKA